MVNMGNGLVGFGLRYTTQIRFYDVYSNRLIPTAYNRTDEATNSFYSSVLGINDEWIHIPYFGSRFTHYNWKSNSYEAGGSQTQTKAYFGGAVWRDGSIILSPADRKTLDRYNPWTRQVEVGATPTISNNAYRDVHISPEGLALYTPWAENEMLSLIHI